jgi:hypothetical protein
MHHEGLKSDGSSPMLGMAFPARRQEKPLKCNNFETFLTKAPIPLAFDMYQTFYLDCKKNHSRSPFQEQINAPWSLYSSINKTAAAVAVAWVDGTIPDEHTVTT